MKGFEMNDIEKVENCACGGEAVLQGRTVRCSACGAMLGGYDGQDAVQTWNALQKQAAQQGAPVKGGNRTDPLFDVTPMDHHWPNS